MLHTPKGLATIALLKTRVDQMQDHLGMFEPFVADALLHLAATDFVAADVKAVLHDRTGILLPADAVQTLLNRFAKKQMLQRAGGRYIRTRQPIPDPGLDGARGEVQAGQHQLADELVVYLQDESSVSLTRDEALVSLATFVSDNKVEILLKRSLPDSPLDRSTQARNLTRAIARFITTRCLASEELRPAFDALVEGILLHDALMLADIRDASTKFAGLSVILDTPLLFSAIGLAGAANGVAATEGLHLLREAGAYTVAFDRTVAEMRRILTVYEDRLATSAGRLSLYPTDITRHVLTTKLTSGDVRVISATLEGRLRKVGVNVRTLPDRDRRFALDEQALANTLQNVRNQDADSPRVRHDVDCIACTLVLRAGKVSNTVERSVAIFATTSGLVIKNTQEWYFAQGGTGMPPIIHHLALTSLAWLKKPAAAPNLKVHELAAICAAVMRPTRDTWERVVQSLQKMEAEGVITSDEAVAVVVSELVEPILARLDDEEEPAADTIYDAIERVRDSYRHEANLEAGKVIETARTESTIAQNAAAEAVGRANAEAVIAQEAAARALARSDQVITAIRRRIARRARFLANVTYFAGVVLLSVATLFSLPGLADFLSPTWRFISATVAVLAAGFGLYGSVRGGSLLSLRDRTENAIARQLELRWIERPLLEPVASDKDTSSRSAG